ncbi:MAG: DNA-directed RNA polymerase subunit P [Candidatus Thermoplasmatota archaeon]|nr:DNA-directed RNA polymerase subunit P [Candidatus Thermoplasmatota archaeon]MCL5963305.1 DNA-directed RNA polymerase subunit P [Candidatus Thermoplasmatota archaeon]
MYRCVKCKEELRVDVGFRMECPNCGSKIFYKERQSTTRVIHPK